MKHEWGPGPDGPRYHCQRCEISKCDDHARFDTCASWLLEKRRDQTTTHNGTCPHCKESIRDQVNVAHDMVRMRLRQPISCQNCGADIVVHVDLSIMTTLPEYASPWYTDVAKAIPETSKRRVTCFGGCSRQIMAYDTDSHPTCGPCRRGEEC